MGAASSLFRPEVDSTSPKKDSSGEILVHFWGVRGGIACPGPDTAKYGGNSACVEVRCGEHTVIFDGGTGIRPLGKVLAAKASAVDADIFFSHFHLDHVGGFPFFAPCYSPTSRLRLWSGVLVDDYTIERAIHTLISHPFFPLRVEELKASIDFNDFCIGETLRPHADVSVQTAMLNHPGGSIGYRLEFAGRSLAYVTDTEHCPGELDARVLELARGTDLMIYDGNYTDEEYPSHVGWGHSTWQQGVRLANAAGARTLAIFHHDPTHHDAALDEIGTQAEVSRPGTIVAREGVTLRLGSKTSDCNAEDQWQLGPRRKSQRYQQSAKLKAGGRA